MPVFLKILNENERQRKQINSIILINKLLVLFVVLWTGSDLCCHLGAWIVCFFFLVRVYNPL